MKLIVAVIQPDHLASVSSALRRAGISGVTVTSAKGFGRENAEADWNLSGDLTSKVKVEIVIGDDSCEEIVNLIRTTTAVGEIASGFIYVQEVLASFPFQPS